MSPVEGAQVLVAFPSHSANPGLPAPLLMVPGHTPVLGLAPAWSASLKWSCTGKARLLHVTISACLDSTLTSTYYKHISVWGCILRQMLLLRYKHMHALS